MKNNFSLAGLEKLFKRSYSLVYFIAISGFLAFTILSTIAIINDSGRTDSAEIQPISGSFDQATIDALKQLEASSGSDEPLPQNQRTNPFSE